MLIPFLLMFLLIGYVKYQLLNCNFNALSHILSSVFDFLWAANIIFLREGLAIFVHARSLEGTLPTRTRESAALKHKTGVLLYVELCNYSCIFLVLMLISVLLLASSWKCVLIHFFAGQESTTSTAAESEIPTKARQSAALKRKTGVLLYVENRCVAICWAYETTHAFSLFCCSFRLCFLQALESTRSYIFS